jgi:hypothetical protein
MKVGAHVKISGDDQRTTWIVPFRQKHNKSPSNQPIALKRAVTLCGAAAVDFV